MRFTRSYPIRFSHCDSAGMVFYPQYFTLFSDHVEDWFDQALGRNFRDFHFRDGLAIPTVSLVCDFVAPSRIGDSLDFWLEVKRLGTSSVELNRGADAAGLPRVKLEQTLVCIDKQSGKPLAWPADLRDSIRAFCIES